MGHNVTFDTAWVISKTINLGQVVYMHVPLSTKQYKLVPAFAGTYCTTGAVLVGWQPIGRHYSWWPTGTAPALLIPVVAIVFIRGLSDVLINEYLFIYLSTQPITC